MRGAGSVPCFVLPAHTTELTAAGRVLRKQEASVTAPVLSGGSAVELHLLPRSTCGRKHHVVRVHVFLGVLCGIVGVMLVSVLHFLVTTLFHFLSSV